MIHPAEDTHQPDQSGGPLNVRHRASLVSVKGGSVVIIYHWNMVYFFMVEDVKSPGWNKDESI